MINLSPMNSDHLSDDMGIVIKRPSKRVMDLLHFENAPTVFEINNRIIDLVSILRHEFTEKVDVLITGVPDFCIPVLVSELRNAGFTPCYLFADFVGTGDDVPHIIK